MHTATVLLLACISVVCYGSILIEARKSSDAAHHAAQRVLLAHDAATVPRPGQSSKASSSSSSSSIASSTSSAANNHDSTRTSSSNSNRSKDASTAASTDASQDAHGRDWIATLSTPTPLIAWTTQQLKVRGNTPATALATASLDGRQSRAPLGRSIASFSWQLLGKDERGTAVRLAMRGAVVHMQLPAGEYTAVLKVVDSMGAAAEESVKFQVLSKTTAVSSAAPLVLAAPRSAAAAAAVQPRQQTPMPPQSVKQPMGKQQAGQLQQQKSQQQHSRQDLRNAEQSGTTTQNPSKSKRQQVVGQVSAAARRAGHRITPALAPSAAALPRAISLAVVAQQQRIPTAQQLPDGASAGSSTDSKDASAAADVARQQTTAAAVDTALTAQAASAAAAAAAASAAGTAVAGAATASETAAEHSSGHAEDVQMDMPELDAGVLPEPLPPPPMARPPQSPPPPPPPPPPPAAMLPSAPASPGTPVPKLKARPVVDNDYGSSDYAPEVALPPAPVRSTTAVTETGAPAGIDG
uniref:PKD/Chitinase domain-containing protein n=1 Tax=Tetradesmus obliquus TaxID=3088 RepID=A0A383VEN6_TETOB|eukprot:jgi/Sobl393_1/17529/SZX63977.1